MSLQGKTIFITGASRGIGKAIALRAAQDGAHIIVAAKTAEPHPLLEGTIYSAVEDIEAAGGQGLACIVDVRKEELVEKAVEEAVQRFGGIDILINNASALSLTGTLKTSMKRYDLMHQVNVRGTYLTSQKCLPYLLKAENPHILNLSPPLNLDPKWFQNYCAYTMTKYGMSMCVLGMAEEFRKEGVGVNALWPRTTIATAAVKNILGGSGMMQQSRTPEIVADAAHWILTQKSTECTGNFFLDEDVLQGAGVSDFKKYAVDPSQPLMPDLFL